MHTQSVSCNYPLCSLIKSNTFVPAPFDFASLLFVPFSAHRVGRSSVNFSWKRTHTFLSNVMWRDPWISPGRVSLALQWEHNFLFKTERSYPMK